MMNFDEVFSSLFAFPMTPPHSPDDVVADDDSIGNLCNLDLGTEAFKNFGLFSESFKLDNLVNEIPNDLNVIREDCMWTPHSLIRTEEFEKDFSNQHLIVNKNSNELRFQGVLPNSLILSRRIATSNTEDDLITYSLSSSATTAIHDDIGENALINSHQFVLADEDPVTPARFTRHDHLPDSDCEEEEEEEDEEEVEDEIDVVGFVPETCLFHCDAVMTPTSPLYSDASVFNPKPELLFTNQTLFGGIPVGESCPCVQRDSQQENIHSENLSGQNTRIASSKGNTIENVRKSNKHTKRIARKKSRFIANKRDLTDKSADGVKKLTLRRCESGIPSNYRADDSLASHNLLEKKRRVHLRRKFKDLLDVVPSLQSVKRAPKILILTNAVDEIKRLEKLEFEFLAEKQVHVVINEFLERKLRRELGVKLDPEPNTEC